MDGCGYRRYQSRDLAPRYVKFLVGLAGEGSLHQGRPFQRCTYLPAANQRHAPCRAFYARHVCYDYLHLSSFGFCLFRHQYELYVTFSGFAGTFATFIMNTLRFSIEKFSSKNAGPRCTVIDVGCNVGAVSIQAAGMGCKVHAFDVQQFAIALVKASVAINGFDTQVNENAVSDVDGDHIPIFLRDGVNLGMTTIVKDLDALVKAPSGQVETIMLDTYAAANDIQSVDFLKIDVEGAEFGVVKGADILIREKRVKVVLCEVWHQHAVETLAFFKERGYRSFHMAATPTAENVWGAEILPAEFASFQASHSPPQYPAGDVVFVLSSLLE
jgi:FkbM family methyltransferase